MRTIRITTSGSFDGTTPADLSLGGPGNPVNNQAFDRLEYTFVDVGRFILSDIPGFEGSDIWVHDIRTDDAFAAFVMRLLSVVNLALPFGQLATAGPALPLKNLIFNIQTQLVVTAAAGELDIFFTPITSKDWARLQCCHRFTPNKFFTA